MVSLMSKKALIIGSARSGNAVAKLLTQNNYECLVIDEKKVLDQEGLKALNIQFIEGPFDFKLLETKYDLVVKNPGIPQSHPFVQACVQKGYFMYTEIEVASWYANNYRYAAITGTNGKTTTTELLQTILKLEDDKNCAAGNVGIPLSEVVLNDDKGYKKIALEIAAFQLLGVKEFHPEVSVILNLAPDHLDVFDTVQDYYDAKALVVENLKEDDWFLKNIDDENINKLNPKNCRIITYSLVQKADLYLSGDEVILFDKVLFNVSDLKIKGLHNVQNAMISSACAYKLGVSLALIQQGIKSFKGVEHRIEFIDEVNGIEYYNDSKATTAESAKVALNAFAKPLIVLVGGYDKKTGFDILKEDLKQAKAVIAFGATKDQFKALYPNTILKNDMKEAFNTANELAVKGDVILLSPACASYDQFNNYEERGRIFKAYVSQLRN